MLLLVLWLLSVAPAKAATDSVRVLGKNDILNIVRAYHPVVLQAGMQVNRAAADVLAARGAFDPVLRTSLDRKTFDGKFYYSYFNPEINIPTWYGIELKAGVEEIAGERVTSEATLGKTSYAGIKVPVNNLAFDRRRAMLRQAQAVRDQTDAERRLAVNDVIYDALSAYWNWVRDYLLYKIVTEAVAVNETRFRFVKTEYAQGARAAIDTTEAMAQLQSFYMQQNAAWLAFQNSGNELSNYLWLEDSEPVAWNSNIIPDTADVNRVITRGEYPTLPEMLATVSNHPKIMSMGFKINWLETERRLKAQYLAPKLSLSGNILSKGYKAPADVSMPYLENNHKVGIDFSVPLFLREARGGFRAVNYKIRETTLEQSNITLKIENKIKSYYNELLAMGQQVTIFDGAYQNYQKLFQGERQRFDIGESSLFLLNTRENKLLESAQKLAELRTKWHKSYAGLMWAAGYLR